MYTRARGIGPHATVHVFFPPSTRARGKAEDLRKLDILDTHAREGSKTSATLTREAMAGAVAPLKKAPALAGPPALLRLCPGGTVVVVKFPRRQVSSSKLVKGLPSIAEALWHYPLAAGRQRSSEAIGTGGRRANARAWYPARKPKCARSQSVSMAVRNGFPDGIGRCAIMFYYRTVYYMGQSAIPVVACRLTRYSPDGRLSPSRPDGSLQH